VKLSHATSYALHALVHIASQKRDQPIASHTIAEAKGLPERFLLKVLKPLTSARMLVSLKGPNGGYRLARSPDRITLLDVIEAVDGPLQGVVPEVGPNGRGKLDEHLRQVCNRTAELVRQRLRNVSVQDLAGKRK